MVKDQFTDSVAARHAMIYDITNEVLNSISIASSLLVICTITYLRLKHKNISNRVSLRLQTFVSISDILFASFQIMTVNSNPPGNWVCHVAPWGFVFAALLSSFLTVAIAFNLQVIFIYNYINTKRFEKYYVIIPFVLSLTLSVVPVIFDALGYDDKEISCWYKHGNTASAVAWQWTTLHGWIILSVLYCSFSIFTIVRRLRQTSKSFIDLSRSNNNSTPTPTTTPARGSMVITRSHKRQLMINQAVKRIMLYPVVPIISFTFNISAGIVPYIVKQNIFEVSMLSNAGTSSQGLFNALMFCFDPAMKKVWDELYENLPNLNLFKKKNDDESTNNSSTGNTNNNISLQGASNANEVSANNNNNAGNNNNNGEIDEEIDPTETTETTETSETGTTICDNNPPSDTNNQLLLDGKESEIEIDIEKVEEVDKTEKTEEDEEDEEGKRVIALL